jgi:hypothetical protein
MQTKTHLHAVKHELDRRAARRRRPQRAQQQAGIQRVEQPRLRPLHADRQQDPHVPVGLDLGAGWERGVGGEGSCWCAGESASCADGGAGSGGVEVGAAVVAARMVGSPLRHIQAAPADRPAAPPPALGATSARRAICPWGQQDRAHDAVQRAACAASVATRCRKHGSTGCERLSSRYYSCVSTSSPRLQTPSIG